MAQETPEARKARLKAQRRANLRFAFFYCLPWAVVWIWLMSESGFPDSYGYHETLHSKAAVLDLYWHSGLLVGQAKPWGIALFVWMWLPVLLFAVWVGRGAIVDIRRKTGKAASDGEQP